MLRVKTMCKNICIYLIVILITITAICLLLISRSESLITSNSAYDIIRAPVKDTLDKKRIINKKVVLNRNSSVLASVHTKEDKHNVVVQIDRHILTFIEDIERSDTAIKRMGMRNYSCSQKSRVINGIEDLLCIQPPKFLPHYKNPCWKTSDGKFHCLPYFQIIGVDKCGSTDLFDRIANHPDVLKNSGVLQKETMWWSWRRYGHWLNRPIKVESFQQYTKFFTTAAKTIQPRPSAGLITGDGTPMDIWDMSGWTSIPQNKGLKEPQYITPHLMKHVNPGVKLIIILRDPVERLFSDYFFLKLGKMTIRGFHEEVIRSIKLLHECTRKLSLRTCLYSRSLHLKLNARIHLGFYSLFLEDWLKVFPREQFLILRTEDYSNYTKEQLQQAFTFLGLRDLPKTMMDKFAKGARKYVTKSKKKAGKMLPKTRVVLERLYRNYNRKLANILKEDRFLWKHQT